MTDRDLDVVVFGATGVTGRRVAAYLADRASETGAGWAAAGRDPAKLERILAEDGVSAPETIVADIGDEESLAKMASRATVVLNLVGPYTLYGTPVIAACAANGAHYADLTGEIPFVRQMIDRFDSSARADGVKLIQVCGFEALPPDLAVLSAAETARERFGEELVSADLEVTVKGPPGLPRPTDMISGGTAQSVAEIAGSEDPSLVTDPAALITDPAAAERVRRTSPIPLTPRRGEHGAVIAPMAPAAFINPAVIQRTVALASDGKASLRYREGIALPGGPATLPLRYSAAGMLAGTQAILGSVTKAGPRVRRRVSGGLRRMLPSSGFGPDSDRLESWSWRMSVTARTGSGNEVRTAVEAEGHPGYLATARMLGEAGLLLAEDGATPDRAGCLTPAIALGTDCLPRFDEARVRFTVEP